MARPLQGRQADRPLQASQPPPGGNARTPLISDSYCALSIYPIPACEFQRSSQRKLPEFGPPLNQISGVFIDQLAAIPQILGKH